jgi:hypothetical protein
MLAPVVACEERFDSWHYHVGYFLFFHDIQNNFWALPAWISVVLESGLGLRAHVSKRRKRNSLRRVSSSGIWRRVVRWVSTDVSEEQIASIFRVEEIVSANQQASKWQQTTRRHIPEYNTLHNHRCENLKSYEILYDCVTVLQSELSQSSHEAAYFPLQAPLPRVRLQTFTYFSL